MNDIGCFSKHLHGRDVYLFGTGKRARSFYNKYKSEISICGCFDNNSESVFLDGLNVLKPARREEYKSAYIIICSVWDADICEQLIELGYTVFDDFCNVYIYEQLKGLVPEKKLSCFLGICTISVIAYAMKFVPEFYHEYNIVNLFIPALREEKKRMEHLFTDLILENCDLLVYNKFVGDTKFIKKIGEISKVISIPLLSAGNYWPQDYTVFHPKEMNEYLGLWGIDDLSEVWEDIMMFNADRYVKAMVQQNRSEEEILSSIMSDNFISREEVLANHDSTLRRIGIMGRGATISMLDYFSQNFRTKRIMADGLHEEECMIREYVKRILNELSIESFSFEEEYSYSHGQMPIYPCVVKHLNLEFPAPLLYKVQIEPFTASSDFNDADYYEVDFEQYYRVYIKRCKVLEQFLQERRCQNESQTGN
jgi:hypothetical protein